MFNTVKKLWTEEEGQGMAEYGLILALVAVVAIGALITLGDSISQKFTDVNTGLSGSDPTASGSSGS
ncbi:pilus assembly protein Flp/PilA [Desulfohalotomaculum tongense]|uniref:Flp family type IVb pilin n=1 Tax=Desulforadius tongensis TaxID=1216062 RepID=UPI001957B6C7|nr:Flp family type IVb pilin [Desulforadius tongensis]MBM7855615.1 pilus assembly protein Flp/PilA [Desulforadius tongensis]